MNDLIQEYKRTFLTKKKKQQYFKDSIEHFKNTYNTIKDEINDDTYDDIYYKNIMENQLIEVKFKFLLFNSILKNDKENIKENFNKFNLCNLETIDFYEELNNNNDDITFIYIENGIKTKGGVEYLRLCNQKKVEYEFFIYVIEDYNKIKL
tara:strand:- start:10 stop:462 length:453 start_codon:yes stop_codon:yes gene_type:complete